MAVTSYFDQAKHNLDVAQRLNDGGHYAWSAFVAGQAGEIAVKGVLTFFAKGGALDMQDIYGEGRHRIDRLLSRFPRFFEKVSKESFQQDAESLSRHFIAARYPVASDGTPPFKAYSQQDAVQSLESARKLVATCENFVNKIDSAVSH